MCGCDQWRCAVPITLLDVRSRVDQGCHAVRIDKRHGLAQFALMEDVKPQRRFLKDVHGLSPFVVVTKGTAIWFALMGRAWRESGGYTPGNHGLCAFSGFPGP